MPTIFNFLGPLANPARVRHQVIGVSDPDMAHKMLGVLVANGCRRAMVIHGSDGLDELSTTGPSRVHELMSDGTVLHGVVDAAVARVSPGRPSTTSAEGTLRTNAERCSAVSRETPGPHRDISVLNSAAGLVVAGSSPDMPSGVEIARSVIDDGRAASGARRAGAGLDDAALRSLCSGRRRLLAAARGQNESRSPSRSTP